MKRRILPFMLMLLSVFVVGKVIIHGLQIQQQVQASAAQTLPTVDEPQDVAEQDAGLPEGELGGEAQKSGTVAWGDLWIPTAEAAASMPIAEEAQAALPSEDLKALQEARAKIAQKEKKLNEHMEALKRADEQVKKRIAELEALASNIQDMLEQEKSIKNKKIKRLTAVYEGMKPDKAAAVISQMDLVTVVKMFSKMNEKQVGKILSFLSPKQAMMISQALTQGIATLQKQ